MEYRYETHCHSSQCSGCAKSTSQELVYAYHAAGYAGLVLTDHFIWGNTAVDKNLPWDQRMKAYYQGYLDAKVVGRKSKISAEQKNHNRALSSKRVSVEHVFAHLKKFKILGSTYRNFRKKLHLRYNIIAGIYNLRFG